MGIVDISDYPRTDVNTSICVGMRIVNLLEYPHTTAIPPVCVGTGTVSTRHYFHNTSTGVPRSKTKTSETPLFQRFSVGLTGFEPATFCSQSRRATKLRYSPFVFSFRLWQVNTRFHCSVCLDNDRPKIRLVSGKGHAWVDISGPSPQASYPS